MLDWAHYYAALGLRVFPIKPGQKSPPMVSDWPKAATADPAALSAWWERWPGANLGIVMGGGLVDIETDVKPGADGEQSLAAWATSARVTIPPTWSFKSGGGGVHRLFRCAGDIPNKVNILPAVDIRGGSGYAVFPPSVHPSGGRYEWLPGYSPADLPGGPAPVPPELFFLLAEDNKAPLEVPAEIIEGNRNDTLFRLACKLRQAGLEEAEILGAVRTLNERRCSPPLDDAEIETICRQAAGYKAGDLPGATLSTAGPLLVPMTTVEPKTASYLISPYLPRGMLAIMGGISGSGKTYLALSWAAAISNGQRLPFQDWTSPAPPSGYVYYFTQENDPNTVIRPRLDLLGADLSKILVMPCSGTTYDRLTLNDPRLEAMAAQYPPTLIIFDPIQSYLGGGVDMNKAERVRPVLDWLGDYAKRHDCTVVLISHMSKPGKGESSALDRLLGSSDFRNAARSIVVVGRDPEDKETRVFAHGKNSIGEPGASQKYHISGAGVTYDGPCDLTADDIIKQSAAARNKPAITLSNAMQLLQNLLEPDGYATLEDVEKLQAGAGISNGTLYNARKELAIKSISIGQPPNRKTWWLRYDVDVEKFKGDRSL